MDLSQRINTKNQNTKVQFWLRCYTKSFRAVRISTGKEERDSILKREHLYIGVDVKRARHIQAKTEWLPVGKANEP